MPSSLFLLATLLLSRPISAAFIPELLSNLADLQDVRKRCDNPCGYSGQLCCPDGAACYTDINDQAQCSIAAATTTAAAGTWEFVTTTYVETDLRTVTVTYSSLVAAATLSCEYSLGESPCGNLCCKSGQYCQTSGMCVAVGGDSSGFYSSLFTVTTVITNTASAPLRPTSDTIVTVTGTGTTTVAFQTPVGTDGAIISGPTPSSSGGGLSGGAIAGIVIGVIAGIIILLLICACCCFKGLIDGLLAIFGLGPRRRRKTEVEEYERRSHRSGRGGRTWFGTRPKRSSVVDEKKKSSGFGTMGWLAAGVGALALALGLKRRHDNKSNASYSSGYYYDDSTISSDESSSDRRTRRSSRSRSRASRGTRR